MRLEGLAFRRIDHLARLARPLPMPATSLYTRDDGVVAWQTCFAAEAHGAADATIEVRSAHATICRNPQALAVVVERLAAGARRDGDLPVGTNAP